MENKMSDVQGEDGLESETDNVPNPGGDYDDGT